MSEKVKATGTKIRLLSASMTLKKLNQLLKKTTKNYSKHKKTIFHPSAINKGCFRNTQTNKSSDSGMPNWFAYITDAPSKKPMLDCATSMLNGKLEDNQIMKINFSLPVAILCMHSTAQIYAARNQSHVKTPKRLELNLVDLVENNL